MKQHKALATILTLAFLTLLSPCAWSGPVFRTLYVFTGGNTGSQPSSGVVMDKFGNLYGTTQSGGNGTCAPVSELGCGVVFQLVPIKHERDSFTSMETDSAKKPVAWRENVLYAFHGEDGAMPVAPLVIDKHGDLFGTTEFGGPVPGSGDCPGVGCGVAFQLSRRGNHEWTEQVIGQFGNGNGEILMAPLTFDDEGNLYGTTVENFGEPNAGTVFKLSRERHGGWTNTELYRFNYYDGYEPMSGVIFDPEGNLYGTTAHGSDNSGNVYRLSPKADGTWAETVLHNFTESYFGGSDEGIYPIGGLVRDRNGNLFGTTFASGVGGSGTVYELKHNADDSWTLRTIHSFGADHGFPAASLVMDKAGALYGNTCGVVFKLTPEGNDNWSEDIIHRFDGTSGCASGPLFMDSMGNLYGTTIGDGKITFGSVFEITP
jgi:hypothetical protein